MSIKNQITTADALPFNELVRLVKCLHGDGEYMWELYVRLSFSTALRGNDVLSLRWSDVLNTGVLDFCEKKTKKTRHILLSKDIQSSVRSLYKKMGCPTKSQYIFMSPVTCAPYTLQLVNSKLKRFKRVYRLNIGRFSTHTFRKTFGRWVYETSTNKTDALIKLNLIFRHASPSITMVYLGIRQEEINDLYENLSLTTAL